MAGNLGPTISSFLGDLNNISVFNQDIFKQTIDDQTGAYKVIITPEVSRALSNKTDLSIKGVLKGGVTLVGNASWGTLDFGALGNLVSNNPVSKVIRTAAQVAGTKLESELGSKKFFTGGGYLTLPLEFRVLDEDETAKGLKAAIIMFALVTPREFASIDLNKALKTLVSFANEKFPENKIEKVLSLGKKVLNGIDNGVRSIESQGGVEGLIAGSVGRGLEEIVHEDVHVMEAPPMVNVKIGNYLELRNMIIDNVTVNFSPEQTSVGPLFADFTVQVSSRYKMVMAEDGLKRILLRSSKGRIERQ